MAKRQTAEPEAAVDPIAPEAAAVDPVALMQSQEVEREQAKQRDTKSAWRRYAQLLLIDKPTKDQAEALVDVARQLGVSANDLATHRRVMEDGRRLEDRHDRFDELHRKHMETKRAYTEFLERMELEEMFLDSVQRHYEHEYHVAHAAAGGLGKLARSYPQFFDQSQNPPRLKK